MADKLYDALTALTEKGGAAFPFHVERNDGNGSICWSGMTLRDYFAGKAMVALMSSPSWVKGADAAFEIASVKFKEGLAGHAYIMADKMLKARG